MELALEREGGCDSTGGGVLYDFAREVRVLRRKWGVGCLDAGVVAVLGNLVLAMSVQGIGGSRIRCSYYV